MGTFKKKKKTFGTSEVTSPEKNGPSPHNRPVHSPLSLRTSALGRLFSFRTPRSSRASPFSPVSVSQVSNGEKQDESLPLASTSNNSFSDEDIVHHSVTSLPRLSANMAALEARTFAESDPLTRQQQLDCLVDRFETKRPPNLALDSLESKTSSEPASSLSQNWLIEAKDFTSGKTIGHSSFGTVTEGKFNGTRVAIKTIFRDLRPNAKNNLDVFKKEVELNCQLRHPNIVLFMGISIQPTQVCIITELMSRGNVRDLLVGKAKGKQLRLDWCLRQQWALDTAQGMAYLHSLNPPMIHRDLKTTNLLVDRGMSVKICDFGLSRIRSDKQMSAVGTVHFSAPEVLRHEQYTEKVDVFSYGTVLWELYMRKAVFQGVPQIEVYSAVVEGNMPSVNDSCDPRFEKLMRECWASDPTTRPEFQEVIERLSVLVEELEVSE